MGRFARDVHVDRAFAAGEAQFDRPVLAATDLDRGFGGPLDVPGEYRAGLRGQLCVAGRVRRQLPDRADQARIAWHGECELERRRRHC